jgi:hypothetical protein
MSETKKTNPISERVKECKHHLKKVYREGLCVLEATNKKCSQRKGLLALGFLYKIVLDIYFMFVVSHYWQVDGLVCRPSADRFLVSWIVYIIGYWSILKVVNYIVSVFLHLQWVLIIAPMIVLFGMQQEHSFIYLIVVLMVLILQVQVGKKNHRMRAISLAEGRIRPYCTITCCILIAAIWIIMVVWNNFEGLKAFNITYIYEMRSHLVFPPMFGYLVSWITRAILPWIFVLGLFKKNVFLILYSCIFQALYYMVLGYKSILLIMGIVFIIYLLSTYRILIVGTYIGLISGIVLGTICGFVEKFSGATASLLFNGILGERTLFIPALIKFQFYDFFSHFPKIHFADGMIGKLFSEANLYKYGSGIIVYAYNNGGSLAVESNTGYLGDSYAQLGFVGMMLIGAMVILLVRFISGYCKHVPEQFLCCVAGCIAVVLNDSAFFTALMTGGIGIWIMMLLLYTGRNENDKL